ncbi:UNVERIFIED_CONTAM: hypothetical protein K2H54_032627 [Gekko kuhli]
MRLLAVLLAVALFAGAQAVLLRDEPRSDLTELKEELQQYMRNISSAVNEKQMLVRRSEIGRQLERYFRDYVSHVKRRWNKLQSELPPEIAEGYNLAATVPIAAVMKTFTTLMELRENLNSAVETLYDLLQPILTPRTTSVLKTVRAHAKTLSARVQEADAILNQNLKSILDESTTWLVPYAQSVRSQWRKFRKTLEPFVDRVQDRLEERVEATKGSWQPYVAPVQKSSRQMAKVFYDLLFRD